MSVLTFQFNEFQLKNSLKSGNPEIQIFMYNVGQQKLSRRNLPRNNIYFSL